MATLATRQSVKAALDVPYTSRLNRLIDESLRAATVDIASSLNVTNVIPWTGTRYRDWPVQRDAGTPGWKLWLRGDFLISLTSLVAGGVTFDITKINLEPQRSGPPYRSIELQTDSAEPNFLAGDTWQRSIGITGTWGVGNAQVSVGTLAASATDSDIMISVSNSADIGVGSLLTIDSERMSVTEMSSLDTTADLSSNLAASNTATLVGLTDTTKVAVGETILVDGERMAIDDIVGSSALVRRAVDGTALAAHLSGAGVYAPRRLSVTRGESGTSAASHASAALVYSWDVPPLLREWCEAETLNAVQQKLSAYVRTVGSGSTTRAAGGDGIEDIRKRAIGAYARQVRILAI